MEYFHNAGFILPTFLQLTGNWIYICYGTNLFGKRSVDNNFFKINGVRARRHAI